MRGFRLGGAMAAAVPLRIMGLAGMQSVHYAPDGADSGGNGDGGSGGASTSSNSDDKGGNDQVFAAEKKKLIAERDRAKQVNRAILESLGLSVEWVDDDDGRRVPKIDGLEKIKDLLKRAEDDEDQKQKDGKWEDRKKQLTEQFNAQLQKVGESAEKRIKSRETILRQLAVLEPLKAALAAEHALDDPDGQGTFSDLVSLLAPRFAVTVDEDEETGECSLSVAVHGADGQPVLDGKGKPMTVRAYVAEFLKQKPHFRAASYRSGSGAGGHGGAGTAGRPNQGAKTPIEHARQAAGQLFGRK